MTTKAGFLLVVLVHGANAATDIALSCDFDHGLCGFNDTGALPWKLRSGSTPSAG